MSEPAEIPALPPEELKMDIHKPHAAKTWKEFFIELGTVVLGILIALSLEQAVENWREHRQHNEARDAMRAELAAAVSNLNARRAISACAERRIAEIGAMLDEAEKHQPFDPPSWIGDASSMRIRFSAEGEAGRSDLFSPAEQRPFSNVYSYLHSIELEQDRERQAWARLQPLEGRASVAPDMIANLRQALAEARFENRRIQFLIGFVNANARPLSLPPPLPGSIGSAPQAFPLCLPMNTSPSEAVRRTAYPGAQ
jgi:hypothetical protein